MIGFILITIAILALLDANDPIVKKLIDVLEWFGDLNESTQKAVVVVVFLAGVSISTITLLGSLTTIASALNFTIPPMIVPIAFVVILTAIGAYLWKD